MVKTKKCPYCGEEILAIAKKCKHCSEWLDETEILSEAPNLKETHEVNDGQYLYCKTCKEMISSSAKICPNCGDVDPFYFDDIKNKYKKANLGCITIIGMAFAMGLIFRSLGSKHGILTWSTDEFDTFLLVVLGFWILRKFISYMNMKEHKEEMSKIFQAKNDSQALDIWKQKLEEKNNN